MPEMSTTLTKVLPMHRLALPALLALAACGGADPGPTGGDQRTLQCAQETRADPYLAGMGKATEGGLEVRLMESRVRASAAAPDRGENTWRVQVVDETGAVRTDLPLRVKAWMPDHGHGTTPLYHVGVLDADAFEVGPFDLFMGGFWQFTVLVEQAGGEDPAVFGFCVEG
jgi:hypothetical protein